MSTRLKLFTISFLSLGIFWPCFSSVSAGGIPKPLKSLHDDTTLPPTCSSDEQSKLKSSIQKLAGSRNPQQAWNLVEALLCGEGKQAEAYVQQYRAKGLTYTSNDTGEREAVRKVGKNEALILQKQAWGALASGGGDKIHVMYWRNEACVAGFEILFNNQKWRLISLGEACD